MKRVLIMEDNLPLALDWISTFELNQCDVTLCDNVEDAINFLDKEKFDLLITDLFVNEEQGGLHLLRRLAKRVENIPPVIAVTGATIPNSKSENGNLFLETAKILGATSYIQKPFPAGELVLMAHSLWDNV